ncbi:GNAT family N-acetyltransferase [Rhodoferax sp.]|uniref:GNAT family N-acetyltransferase n=1 Tax=Rhodoferax sp. TaxID=50421 RepID=UPI00284D0D19|nr:GNAT family N-acetyltransferase [Rhodoferax sp.]MDR3368482.1 GNAT family N-acetyltransferase [Rhodoferax sp.]
MSQPAIQILDNFDSLRELLIRHGLTEQASEAADVFATLAWFANLAASGLDTNSQGTAIAQWWLAGDVGTGPAVCLPLLSGQKLTGLSNYYSSLFAPLIWPAPGTQASEAALLQALGQAIRQHPARWPVLMFDPIDPQSNFFGHWSMALRQAGYAVDSYFCFGNWYLQVAGRSFATYSEGLPSPLRHSIARGQRRLSRQGAWRVDIQQLPDVSLDAAIDDFVAVYEKSWKGPEPNRQFIPALARMAAAQGWLRLGVLRLDGQAIAAQLWLVKGGKASIFKLAYITGFERFSAGSVLTSALMRHVIDVDQVQEVDYLTGDDAYKRDWMSHRRERWGIVAFDRRTLAGLSAWFRHWVGKKFKRHNDDEKVSIRVCL